MKKVFLAFFSIIFLTLCSCLSPVYSTSEKQFVNVKPDTLNSQMNRTRDKLKEQFDSDFFKQSKLNFLDSLLRNSTETISPFSLSKSFDKGKGMNKFGFQDGKIFYSNILPDMTTSSDVVFVWPNDVGVYVFKDDEVFDISAGASISEHGYYRAVIVSKAENGVPTPVKNFITLFNFRIVKKTVNNLLVFNAPPSSEIVSVVYFGDESGDDIKLSVNDPCFFKMSDNGTYRIHVKDKNTGNVYSDTFCLCNVIPKVRVENAEGRRSSKSPVSIVNEDENFKVSVFKNGGKVYDKIGRCVNTFSERGRYCVYVEDTAGNKSDYNFTVKSGLKFAWFYITLILAGIFAYLFSIALYFKRRIEIR